MKKTRKTNKKLKQTKIVLTFCVCVALLMLVMPFLPVRDEGGIYDNTLRLHVLANSDTTEDQQLKLLVRDAVVKEADSITEGIDNFDDAKSVYSSKLEQLKNVAQNVVYENGYSYKVDVVLSEEYYPERQYGTFRLPSGRYNSLKVSIGESEGQNWWCVLFPPLCVDAAKAEEELVQTGFTPNQIRLLTDSETPEYVIRFRILEWVQDIAELFKK
ncbi:MAG: stage II sporulation protein R [Clostridia bacterium]|nr:stage II sporulation protein R [Clostridia bacterium]